MVVLHHSSPVPASEKGRLVRGIKVLDRVIPSNGFALNNRQYTLLKVATA